MKIYKKKVKKHEEVWAEGHNEWEEGNSKIRICMGNSNYGRLYVMFNEERGQWLDEEETKIAFGLFKEVWDDPNDNPFSDF